MIKHFSYQLVHEGKIYLVWFDEEAKRYMCTGVNGKGVIEFPIGFDAFDADGGIPKLTDRTIDVILKEVAVDH